METKHLIALLVLLLSSNIQTMRTKTREDINPNKNINSKIKNKNIKKIALLKKLKEINTPKLKRKIEKCCACIGTVTVCTGTIGICLGIAGIVAFRLLTGMTLSTLAFNFAKDCLSPFPG
ncbi:hypothetical protein ACFLYU_02870 [Candidatus Dependentiae bacterium]